MTAHRYKNLRSYYDVGFSNGVVVGASGASVFWLSVGFMLYFFVQ